MIKANELRIGNWYNFKNPMGDTFTPSIFDFWTEAIGFEAYGEPIPLTPEILEKCGFKKSENEKFFKRDFYILVIDEDGSYAFGTDTYDGYFTDIKYLHQLQNLYFALTGEELKINLP